MEVKDIVALLMRRDSISEEEAWSAVNGCMEEMHDILDNDGLLMEVEDAVYYWLGLEPDYAEVLLNEIADW